MLCGTAFAAHGQAVEPAFVARPDPLAGRERLGQAVAVVPGLIVCGAPGYEAQGTDAGGVLVFRLHRGLDRWVPDAWLTVPGASAGDGFGAALAASGSTLAIGSSGENRVAIVDLDDPAAAPVILAGGPDFGRSLAIEGDTLIVGEPQRAGQIGRGRVTVFERTTPSGWNLSQTLSVDTLGLNAGFGVSVALLGNRLLVGAPSAFGTGAAFYYTRPDDDAPWTLNAAVQPANAVPNDQFGAAVALGDRELLIGAPAADVAAPNGGSATIVPILLGTDQLGPPTTLFAPSPATNALFGSAVAARGDLIAITAPLGDGLAGGAWVFRRLADESFTPAQRLAATTPEPFAGFGTSIAIADEFIAAGAPQLDASPFDPDAGAVNLYRTLAALGYADDCNDNGTDDLVDLFVTRTATDCNGNGRIDACEIAENPDLDSNNDGVLDGCDADCPADQNFDGLLTPADFTAWLLNYSIGCP